MDFRSYQPFSIGDPVHIGYMDRSSVLICQGEHLLEADWFEGVNVQSVVCVCVWGRGCM